MRTDILEQKERILQWIAEEKTKAYMCEQLHCKPTTLNAYLEKMGIQYAGQQARKGQYKGEQAYKNTYEYLASGTTVKSHILKLKLIRDGIKEQKCELCGVSEWQGRPLPLELHHKDGNHYNNEIENLVILCPNCHSIQEGNSGANTGKYKCKSISNYMDTVSKAKEKKEISYLCVDCQKPISKGATRCKSCAIRERQKDKTATHPNREELKNLIRTTSFLQIGKTYNVSDNAVRKWCDGYGLPRKSSEIKSYSNEEWEKI